MASVWRSQRAIVLALFLIGLAPAVVAQNATNQFTRELLSEFRWRLVGPSSPAGRVWQVVGAEPTSVRNMLVVRKETDGVRVGSVRK